MTPSPSASLTGSTAATLGSAASSAPVSEMARRRCRGERRCDGASAGQAAPAGRRRDAAMSDDDRSTAHRLDLFEQMRRDDDRLFASHGRDDLAHLVLLVGVEPVGRLVQNDDVGIVEQCLSDPDAALETLRQSFDWLMQDLGNFDHLDDTPYPILGFAAGEAANVGDKVEKGGGRHVGIGRSALGR